MGKEEGFGRSRLIMADKWWVVPCECDGCVFHEGRCKLNSNISLVQHVQAKPATEPGKLPSAAFLRLVRYCVDCGTHWWWEGTVYKLEDVTIATQLPEDNLNDLE